MHLLDSLQVVLAQINDAPVSHRVSEFHLAERSRCAALLGRDLVEQEDEQVLFSESEHGVGLSVYIDAQVLQRLQQCNPLQRLDAQNLADFCTAVEGISHFHYLVWCLLHDRQVSLLELELQAEVDKYALASLLVTRQHGCRPSRLHYNLFDRLLLVAGLPLESRQRYQEAHHHAAYFCQRLERQCWLRSRWRLLDWLRRLRTFYRCAHHHKLRYALS